MNDLRIGGYRFRKLGLPGAAWQITEPGGGVRCDDTGATRALLEYIEALEQQLDHARGAALQLRHDRGGI